MNRYFLYLVLSNMMTNTIIFVPKILIEDRYDGAVMGIIIAIPLGLVLMIISSKLMGKFPEQALPELLEKTFGNKFKIAVLICLACIWYSAGLITLLGYIDIINRYINPEIGQFLLMLPFLGSILFVIQLTTQKVMYLLEMILFINTPLIVFLIFKAYTSENLNWNSILEVGTHWLAPPNFEAVAAASYAFSGYANVLIFNRLFKEKIKNRNFVAIFFLVIFNLFTTFFIPIGIHGADGAQEYLYPWISTADSLRMTYGPIERVIFIFLMFYLSITLLSVSVHWHVTLEFLKGLSANGLSNKQKWLILVIFSGLSILAVLNITTLQLIQFVDYWLQLRVGVEISIILLIFIIGRRQKKK
ncbi:GerAB/ArcD/ProY family transporter [Bacillota bacterium Lsc_1132]